VDDTLAYLFEVAYPNKVTGTLEIPPIVPDEAPALKGLSLGVSTMQEYVIHYIGCTRSRLALNGVNYALAYKNEQVSSVSISHLST